MILKYRKKAIVRLALGFGLLLLGLIVGGVASYGHSKVGEFIGVVSAIIGYLIFVFGCVDLLKSKGYDSNMVLAFLVPAFCCSAGFVLFAPPVILFAMKDKTRKH